MGIEFEHLVAGEEFYFQWHITEKCNLRCRHCYHDSYGSTNELDKEKLFNILLQIDSAASIWGRRATLSITGGEPLLRRGDLLELIYAIEKKENIYYFDLLTNGTLLDKEFISKLYVSSKLRRVQISLEGSDININDQIRGKGNFVQVVSAIQALRESQINVSIMNTLNRGNVAVIPDMINLAAELGASYISFERFIPAGNGKLMADQLLTAKELQDAFELITHLALKEKRVKILTYRPLFALCDADASFGAMCSIGTNALTIMHDGIVYPCRRLPLPLGNILDDGLFKIWYDSRILWEIRDCRNLKGKCNGCDSVSICRGCRAMAYSITGDYLAEDPQCWK